MDAPGHILESTKGIEMKLGLYIDGSERKEGQCIRTTIRKK